MGEVNPFRNSGKDIFKASGGLSQQERGILYQEIKDNDDLDIPTKIDQLLAKEGPKMLAEKHANLFSDFLGAHRSAYQITLEECAEFAKNNETLRNYEPIIILAAVVETEKRKEYTH